MSLFHDEPAYRCEIRKKGPFLRRIMLRLNRFHWDRTSNRWIRIIRRRDIPVVRAFFDRRGIPVTFRNADQMRSSTYRAQFFKNNRGLLGRGRVYRCVYCGCLRTASRITVDHLYPVELAGTDPAFLKKMQRAGIENVNDPANLVPACRRCNRAKSTSAGIWILRGRLGSIWWFWPLLKILFLLLLLFLWQRYGAFFLQLPEKAGAFF